MTHYLRRLLAFVLGFALSSCGSIGSPTTALISEEAAIDAAKTLWTSARPETGPLEGDVSGTSAEQMSLGDALAKLPNGPGSLTMLDLEMQVWLVSMDGFWESLPPGPDIPSQQPYRHVFVVIDASTGQEIVSSASP